MVTVLDELSSTKVKVPSTKNSNMEKIENFSNKRDKIYHATLTKKI
jgi:hypothetical protein